MRQGTNRAPLTAQPTPNLAKEPFFGDTALPSSANPAARSHRQLSMCQHCWLHPAQWAAWGAVGPKSCLGATGPWEQRPDPATQLWVRSLPPRGRMGACELCQAGSAPCPSRLIFGDKGSAGPWGASCCLPPSLQPHGSSRVMLGGILLPPPPGAAGAALLHVAPYHACSRAGGGGGEPGGRGRAPAAPGSYCSWLSPFQSM